MSENPYLDACRVIERHTPDKFSEYRRGFPYARYEARPGRFFHARPKKSYREFFTKRYSWAIPDAAAIEAIAKLSPIIEIGAGSGYWANLIAKAGADIVAFDIGEQKWPHRFFDVRTGGPEQVSAYPGRTLLLCWPPFWNGMDAEAVRRYHGDTLIYVGELSDGCTGSPKFQKALSKRWELADTVCIPQWEGIHDELGVYRRLKARPHPMTLLGSDWRERN